MRRRKETSTDREGDRVRESGRRILFVGGTRRGLEFVEYLVESKADLVGIYCLREDEHERVKVSPQIEKIAKKNGVPFWLTRTISGERYRDEIRRLEPDLIVAMGWRSIIAKEILRVPKFGCVAVHESKLPAYRGSAPVAWQIINGEKEIGVTLFYLDEGMDSGDVIAQRVIPIGQDDYFETVYQKTAKASLDLLKENIPLVFTGKAPRQKQDERAASYACVRTPDDGGIDWAFETRKIYNLIRALSYPYPGAFSFFEKKRLRIWEANPVEALDYVGRIPGRVAKVWKGKGAEVLTGDGQILLTRVQIEDGEVVTGDAILNSIKIRLGR